MRRGIVLLAAFFAFLATPTFAQDQHKHRRPDDIKQYLEHLDRAERDQYQKPTEVMDALSLKPGMAVADLGSGSGYFTRRFVEAVTETGIVYAVDVEPEMLAYVKDSVIHMHIPYRAEFILARPDSPKLPMDSVDLIFVCNTAHHLDNRSMYFRNLGSALRTSGRIVIIDFHPDERSGDLGFPKHHLVPRDTIIKELEEAGYRLHREHTFLPRQYFLEFMLAQE
jgi:ubiquinone/menaquinone biosynthesis C-methylase UbiE